MLSYVPPEPLSVDFKNHPEEGAVSMLTWLFRKENNLPHALHVARELAVNPQEMTVVSAGCSIGAEVDSMLVLHRLAGYAGSLSVTGYDYSEFAIETACKGRYRPQFSLGSWGSNRRDASRQSQMLRDYGFVLRGDAPGYEENYPYRYFDVDACRLRSHHDVAFTQANLLQPLPGTADLITVNNVLFHWPLDDALKVISNLAGMLSENGVLSIGEDGLVSQLRGNTEPYNARQQIMPTLLNDEFGLNRLKIPSEPDAIMFSRAELHAEVGLDLESVGVGRGLAVKGFEAA